VSASRADGDRELAAEAPGNTELTASRKWLLTVSVMVVAVTMDSSKPPLRPA